MATRVRTGSTRLKETRPRTGIQFITDAQGRKTAAVIDLKKHRALWEDIEDVLVSRSRRHEKRIPLEKVKADLIASGKLHGLAT
jgi:phage baseplate assembly protein W